jgi:hypothetical protein
LRASAVLTIGLAALAIDGLAALKCCSVRGPLPLLLRFGKVCRALVEISSGRSRTGLIPVSINVDFRFAHLFSLSVVRR